MRSKFLVLCVIAIIHTMWILFSGTLKKKLENCTVFILKLISIMPDNVAGGNPKATHKKLLQVVTTFDRNIYIGLAQFKHDMGLPYIQDVIRVLTAQALKSAGYPKEVHPVQKISGKANK
jgi:hypothetical protein